MRTLAKKREGKAIQKFTFELVFMATQKPCPGSLESSERCMKFLPALCLLHAL